jgi:UDP-N-acetylmuramoyl-L-alanyl-D-glutamate--2,6-diaminopimelate ligase
MLPEIFPVTCHTDHVGPGSTFVAIQGMREDGISYIAKALHQGAGCIVVEDQVVLDQALVQQIEQAGAKLMRVSNARKALAELSASAAGYPACQLNIIGITGTKGKTTTTFLLEHILKSAGYRTALLSTVKNRIKNMDMPTMLTTPQPDYLHVFLQTCVQQGVEWVVMEVAAQALSLHRVDGIIFKAGIFTNFAQEHGEFYATQEHYFAAKTKLLEQISPTGFLVLNQDDTRVASLDPNHKTIRFGLNDSAPNYLNLIEDGPDGLVLQGNHMDAPWQIKAPALVGAYNAYNLAAAGLCALNLEIPIDIVRQAVLRFSGVPGRLDKYRLPNGVIAFIDYAHNPASYEAVLSTLGKYTDHLIVVFGAGGERDPARRPHMGAIAAKYAQTVILTTDNPRSEDPAVIVQEIKAGIQQNNQHKIYTELDRDKAIRLAYALARSDSVIALLGKGPDEYQHINGVKHFFSEAKILRSL